MEQEQLSGDAPVSDASAADYAAQIERLYLDHNAALLRFLASKLGSHHEAREVAQEAYVRLLSLDRPGAISFLRAFLYKIASNLAMDRLRSRSRHSRLGELHAAQQILDLPHPPDVEVATGQELARLRAALDTLPGKCRQAFLLHKFQGLSMVEVATELGVSDRMVRHYITRALLHCRRALDVVPVEGSNNE